MCGSSSTIALFYDSIAYKFWINPVNDLKLSGPVYIYIYIYICVCVYIYIYIYIYNIYIYIYQSKLLLKQQFSVKATQIMKHFDINAIRTWKIYNQSLFVFMYTLAIACSRSSRGARHAINRAVMQACCWCQELVSCAWLSKLHPTVFCEV